MLTATTVGVLGTAPVTEVVLFQSQLLPAGPVYTALARAPLTGSALPAL